MDGGWFVRTMKGEWKLPQILILWKWFRFSDCTEIHYYLYLLNVMANAYAHCSSLN